MVINIAKEYTRTPGGRFRKEGQYSGEDFREYILKPAFERANQNGEKLVVILDGGFGYGSSFLEEAFGGLARQTKDKRLLNIEIVSEEEPRLAKDIIEYITDALKEKKA